MKVYLSKSKQADPDIITSVKKALKEEIVNLEILEYKGGYYNSNLKFNAELVICIPPSPVSSTTNKIHVGRGNYSEVTECLDKGISVAIIAYKKGDDLLDWKNLMVVPQPDFELSGEENWQINWGIFSGIKIKLIEYLSPYSNKEEESLLI
jgi:hypothetical protein